ncbi:SHOCT domain-containing protein [Actinoplanes sp. NBRC 101535]|uniref:SHOCT domain-containing protein n=1 Tax=Actinoplanes sp. NBRC 101535 TaxID=3032196 RepID=UPI0024A3A77E|nr:SHOCT domain-containing protein [Actinoplanes sp. NBRC 101535]GLY06450.1 hypothetical protein Acsp01_68290 [Actinoplanes sp. NBRC 101535]
MMMHYYPHFMPMGTGWSVILPALLLALIVTTLVAWRPPRRDEKDRADRILAERFARGEIDAEEYEQRRRTLEHV